MGTAAWTDRHYTWTNLGHFTHTYYDYKLKTSVSYRQTTLSVIPPSRYDVVMLFDAPGDGSHLSSSWSACPTSWRIGSAPYTQSSGGYTQYAAHGSHFYESECKKLTVSPFPWRCAPMACGRNLGRR